MLVAEDDPGVHGPPRLLPVDEDVVAVHGHLAGEREAGAGVRGQRSEVSRCGRQPCGRCWVAEDLGANDTDIYTDYFLNPSESSGIGSLSLGRGLRSVW